MIVVDTSALMAIVLSEPEAARCRAAIHQADAILISSGTFAEVLIVAARRGIRQGMARLLNAIHLQIIDVTPERAILVAQAYDAWGKGVHPARLNMGDCFAYALAKAENCPLLFVGNDFAQTDIAAA